ncbi:DinB family protein [Paenibacillus sp. VCA1]|uniref:DinB family protein n=1 Tax=Paenibacillus sp. VCA1 TaxID=3039148 RepID=UPI0037CBDF62
MVNSSADRFRCFFQPPWRFEHFLFPVGNFPLHFMFVVHDQIAPLKTWLYCNEYFRVAEQTPAGGGPQLKSSIAKRLAVTPTFEAPRIGMARTLMFNHVYHHGGQLMVYLRLLGISVPGVYGPSAERQSIPKKNLDKNPRFFLIAQKKT